MLKEIKEDLDKWNATPFSCVKRHQQNSGDLMYSNVTTVNTALQTSF